MKKEKRVNITCHQLVGGWLAGFDGAVQSQKVASMVE
jgi:hypothetical protein